MSLRFLVEITECPDFGRTFACISAADAETARVNFLRTYAPTDAPFLAYVYRTSINLSFAEYFWIQTDEEMDLFEQNMLKLNDAVFTARVREFFGAHHDYAECYLAHYFGPHTQTIPEPGFPPEMLAYIWLHTCYGELSVRPVACSEDE